MKIITLSRQFGSGGRELGKRMADILGFDYYDREIISAIAKNKGLDESYVEKQLERPLWQTVPLTYGHSFANIMAVTQKTDLMIEEKKVIENIATLGRDFIIVGRCADVYLSEYNPFNIFVCADMRARIKRCISYEGENANKLSEKAIEHNIKKIDKNRAELRSLVADTKWSDACAYHLCVNTTDRNIKDLAVAVCDFAEKWFAKS